jgi:putative endonuclease
VQQRVIGKAKITNRIAAGERDGNGTLVRSSFCENGHGVPVSRHNIELGRWGEQLAETLLVKLGAKVLARNYRSEAGEIDIVVDHEDDLVAVEVKTRTELDFELPEEAVTRWKLQRMILGLQTYAQDHDMQECHWRLDVVAVEIDLDGTVRRCEHLRDVYMG